MIVPQPADSATPHPFRTTGGVRLGWTNATWPLAELLVAPDCLIISVWLLGEYTFSPEQVDAVEPYTLIPVLAWGIRVRHCRTDYPQQVVFWHLGSPNSLLRRIRDAGFSAAAPTSAVPHRRGIAARWSAILVAFVSWNAFFLLDCALSNGIPPQPGPFVFVALLLSLALCIGTLMRPELQRLVLKPGRSVEEIRPFLRLLAVVSGFVLIVCLIISASGGFSRRIS